MKTNLPTSRWATIVALIGDKPEARRDYIATNGNTSAKAILSRAISQFIADGRLLERIDADGVRWIRMTGKQPRVTPLAEHKGEFAKRESALTKQSRSRTDAANEVSADVAEFLAKGGKIEKLPPSGEGSSARPLKFIGLKAINEDAWRRKEAKEAGL